MAATFQLRLLRPNSEVFIGPVEALMMPGESGDFGVLAGHTKFVTTLRPGQLRLVAKGKTQRFAMSGGFAEVHDEGVTVLASSVECPEDIDVARAMRCKQEAEAALLELDPSEALKIARFKARLARALNRLDIASRKD